MKQLKPYLKPYLKETILAPLFKLFEAILELFVPLIMAVIIDKGIGNKDTTLILHQGAILICLGILGVVVSITAQYFAAKAATGFTADVRQALFSKIQYFSFSQLDALGNDTLLTRLTSDINLVQSGLNIALRLLLRSPFIVGGAIVMAFVVNVEMAWTFVITVPILAIVVFGIIYWTIPMYRRVQGKLDRIMRLVHENLLGVRVIRAFNREEKEIQSFREDTETLNQAQQKVSGLSGAMNPITFVIVNVALIVILYGGAIKVDTGTLSKGDVIALTNYMSQILVELVKFANLVVTMTKSVASAERIDNILSIEPDMVEGTKEVHPEGEVAVAFKDVTLTYQGDQNAALNHISFTALKGQTVGVIGGTGSGKSSLVNMIPRFYDATQGEVEVFGNDVRDYRFASIRGAVAMVLQKAQLFRGTIADNVRFGNASASTEVVEHALDVAQASEFVQTKEGGLDYGIEQNGRNLSGGQKQRMTIARAIAKQAPILILDDSASALDFATDAKLREAIKNQTPRPTTFIVSQRAASVQYADLILVLDEGNLVGKGTHEELLAKNEIYQEIYYSQFPKEDEA
ncbi:MULTISPECIES: ABC transporter ATP-binding protein [unclassified Granulicatella]|uniref:ABC transporter ATP-binding protein n=1 Tax=unclassified Granulicatella TaxID=2630493 RepID=UPI000660A2F8|nr:MULTISPECIES: ABC transporter ATP-binding protein [unclassified Granulicatella]MDK8380439.1 ABC transporter ATP-binding protein [Granulicatella sp. UMB5615B]MDK8523363.1 ABC transporter ATP-binding protein [Granulicatella sp. UMB5615A]